MMKYRIIKFVLACTVLWSGAGCDSFLDVNDNPDMPVDAPMRGLMTNSTFETANNVYRMGSLSANYVQYFASPNPASSSDIMERVSYNDTWGDLYDVMTDLHVLIQKAQENGANQYLGTAQILMALNLGMTVDAFGDIPYSEAFDFATITPKYDDDQAIYQEVLRLLDEGIQNLQLESTYAIDSDDFFYGNGVDIASGKNIENWMAFAHVLKARYMLHLKETEIYDQAQLLADLENGFTSNSENAKMNYFENSYNPWYQLANDNANLDLGGWISEQFIQALDSVSYPVKDPRLPLMVGATKDGEYVGTVNGAGRGNAPEQGARSTLIEGQYYTSQTSPVLIATYAEQKFIEAEATFDTDKNRSYAAYLAGIEAHMDMLGVEPAAKQKYLTDPVVAMGVNNFQLADIFKEKYVALFLHPETWNDARRFDYGYKDMTLPANLNPELNGQYIRRVDYPDNEKSRNGSNVPQVSLLDRIFWDVE